jgi:hypothetical protein
MPPQVEHVARLGIDTTTSRTGSEIEISSGSRALPEQASIERLDKRVGQR